MSTIIIDENTKRIRWNRLEQFVSISSNADRAISGDFSALKVAQERSDVIKAFKGEQETQEITYEVSIQILDFLLSENGRPPCPIPLFPSIIYSLYCILYR